jgi:hypothetical protein
VHVLDVYKSHFSGWGILATHFVPSFVTLSQSISGGPTLETYPNQNEEGSRGEPLAPAELGHRPAPIAILSPAKRAALIAFLHGDGTLHKSRGVWIAQPATVSARRIYGMTIADLARDGMLTVTVIRKNASARLTPRGTWFAQTLAADMRADERGGDPRQACAGAATCATMPPKP